jgi:nitrate reductase alpha subunit
VPDNSIAEVLVPAFDGDGEAGRVLRRGVPVRRIGEHLVTTVYDLMLAQYGVGRPGLPGTWPSSYEDVEPYTPAWQEEITSVPASQAIRIAREFARNAEESGGRSMILMGAGTNHWFHSDTIYRAFLALVSLTGCQGVNGGGWAHYVGQEKCRPVTGWSQLAFGLDWQRPPRQMIGTAFWYLHTDQWRYDGFGADALSSPLGEGRFDGMSMADCLSQSARMGWMPSYPTFNRNPLDLADEADAAGVDPAAYVVDELRANRLWFAGTDPDSPENWPRVLTVWRANLLGSSGKGNEYFLQHLLGTDATVRADESAPEWRPRDVVWHDNAPEGKLDLLVSLDFRMTSTTLFSDVVLPAATWYEKHDLSSTDMHPFVHAFSPAINPPWQTRTDYDAFQTLAGAFSELAKGRLDTRRDVVAVPLLHDTPDELANPRGVVRDWRTDGADPEPGRTMPKLVVIERDFPAVAEKMAALGPLVERLGTTTKGWTVTPDREVEDLRRANGVVRGGVADGRPSLARDIDACETILALSGTTNGRLAVAGFRALEERTGTQLADLALDRGQADHVRRYPGSAGAGDHVAGVVGFRARRSSLHGVRRQHRAAEALAHADRPAALLSRPRLDGRARGAAAGLSATVEPASDLRRPGTRRPGRWRRRGDRPLPDAALEVVDPLRVPGQSVPALVVPWRVGDLDEPAGRRADRRPRQRVDRGGQPQWCGGRAVGGLASVAGRDRVHVPRQGQNR